MLLHLHPLHGRQGDQVRPFRSLRSQGYSSAQRLADLVGARGLPSSSAAEGCGTNGALCRLEGSTLFLLSGSQEFGIELVLAETGHAQIIDTPDSVAVSFVPHVLFEQGAQDQFIGWVLLCKDNEKGIVLNMLAAAGCLRTDLNSVCRSFSEDVLGTGGFSKVVRARMADGFDVAVKQIDGHLEAVLREVSCLVNVKPHPNIVRFHGLFTRKGGLGIVLDCAAGGDLWRHCCTSGCLTEAAAASLLLGVLAALAHLHSFGVVHRDVKPENVLLMANGRSVLADFGAAARLSSEGLLTLRIGSLGYVAPEVLMGQTYGCAVDCFGAGGVLHLAIAGSPPFEGRCKQVVMQKTCECRLDLEVKPWNRISADCKELLRQLLCRSPHDRVTAEEAIEHSWFRPRVATCAEVKQDNSWPGKICFLEGLLRAGCRVLNLGL